MSYTESGCVRHAQSDETTCRLQQKNDPRGSFFYYPVAREGLEPSHPKVREFESRASANSATSPNSLIKSEGKYKTSCASWQDRICGENLGVNFLHKKTATGTSFLYMTQIEVADGTLIAAAKKGDLEAFNTLILRYQKLVYNIALRMMGEGQSAEDATQEAFIKAHKAIKRLRGDNFKSWIARIVTNVCLDEIDKRKRRPQTSLDALTSENESAFFMRAMTDMPEAAAQRSELMRLVVRCLGRLSAEYRAALILRLQGYDYSEIQTIIRQSLGTVKSRISRARKQMQSCLGKRELL